MIKVRKFQKLIDVALANGFELIPNTKLPCDFAFTYSDILSFLFYKSEGRTSFLEALCKADVGNEYAVDNDMYCNYFDLHENIMRELVTIPNQNKADALFDIFPNLLKEIFKVSFMLDNTAEMWWLNVASNVVLFSIKDSNGDEIEETEVQKNVFYSGLCEGLKGKLGSNLNPNSRYTAYINTYGEEQQYEIIDCIEENHQNEHNTSN